MATSRNLRLTIQYVGTRYRGWQSQPAGDTIQDRIQAALAQILQEPVRLTGAGRTDSGVHARGQVAHFHTTGRAEPLRLRRAVNSLLPPDIRIRAVAQAPPDFHACRDAVRKVYVYRMAVDEVVSPFVEPFVHQIRGSVRIEAMQRAARAFLGEHDFSSFCAAETRVRSRVRRIFESSLEPEDGSGILAFRVSANGFLQHMVRTLAGTLIEVGRQRIPPEDIPGILERRDRRAAGPCAPAKGLILEEVHY